MSPSSRCPFCGRVMAVHLTTPKADACEYRPPLPAGMVTLREYAQDHGYADPAEALQDLYADDEHVYLFGASEWEPATLADALRVVDRSPGAIAVELAPAISREFFSRFVRVALDASTARG